MPLRMVPGKRWILASKGWRSCVWEWKGPGWGAFQSWLAPGQEGDSGNWGDISQAGQLPQQAQQTSPRKPCPPRTCCRLTTSSARGAPRGPASEVALVLCPGPGPQKALSPGPSQPHAHSLQGPPGVRNSSVHQGEAAYWERAWPGNL